MGQNNKILFKTRIIFVIIMLTFSLWTAIALPQKEKNRIETLTKQEFIADYIESSVIKPVNIPFSGFIQNQGQISDRTLQFYYSTRGLSVGFASSEIKFVTRTQDDISPVHFSLTFPGATRVKPVGLKRSTHYMNYFYANLEYTKVPTFNEVWYYDLYPGIDLRYYMSIDGLKIKVVHDAYLRISM